MRTRGNPPARSRFPSPVGSERAGSGYLSQDDDRSYVEGLAPERATAYSITTERASARYEWTGIAGAVCQGTMSCGESRAVSIHRRHGFSFADARQLELERLPVGVQDEVEQETLLGEVLRPGRCYANSRPSPAGGASLRARPCSPLAGKCSGSRADVHAPRRACDRRAASRLMKRWTSACFSRSVQSNQLDRVVMAVGVVVAAAACGGPRRPSGSWARPATSA